MAVSRAGSGRAFRVLEWISALALGSVLTWWMSDHQIGSGSAARAELPARPSSSPITTTPKALTRGADRITTATRDAVGLDSLTARQTARAESREKSRDVMHTIEARAHDVALTSPDQSPEGIANRMSEYMVGLADALEQATPEMAEAMSEQIEQSVCAEESKPTGMMLQMRLLRRLPAFATTKTFECFFARRTEEDAVLWEGIDALAGTDIERPEALERLRATAVKSQTRTRFMSQEEYAAYVESERAAAVTAGRRAPSGDDPLALQPAD